MQYKRWNKKLRGVRMISTFGVGLVLWRCAVQIDIAVKDNIITWSQLNHSSFSQELTVCTNQDLGRQYSMLPSLSTTQSSFKSPSWCRSLCEKWEFFFVKPEVKIQWTVLVPDIGIVGYLTISTNVIGYRTRCRRQYDFVKDDIVAENWAKN